MMCRWQRTAIQSVSSSQVFMAFMYTSDTTVRVLKMTPFSGNVFPNCVCCTTSSANWKASSANRKVSSENRVAFSEDVEGFLRRSGRILAQTRKVLNFTATSVYSTLLFTCPVASVKLQIANYFLLTANPINEISSTIIELVVSQK